MTKDKKNISHSMNVEYKLKIEYKIKPYGMKDEEFENLDAMQDMRLGQISSTIIDDLVASGYATEEKIRTLLGE